MRANDVRPTEPTRYGAYVCLSLPPGTREAVADMPVPVLAGRLGLRDEFDHGGGHPQEAIAFLRGADAASGDIADGDLLNAGAVVHVASATPGPVAEFCRRLTGLLNPVVTPRILHGVVRPITYAGTAMYNFAYAHQQSAALMPNAFLIPLSKTAAWWEKDWMERHTYFLPRYDDSGDMVAEGHALAAAAGIGCLMRRFYKHPAEPAPAGAYDFVTYFECADQDVPRFHEVCNALRDTTRNPEWNFVREGPTWHGKRVATWAELFE